MTALRSALIALGLAAGLSASAPAQAAKFRLAWVDIVSEDNGTWLSYDLPMLGATPGTVGMRFLYQVQPVWGLPVENLYFGTSLQAQTLHYERTMKVSLGPGDLGWYGGLQTRLFMPNGAIAGLRWKTTRTRLALGASAFTPSTWRRPGVKTWSVMPSLGVSIVLGKPEPESRFQTQPIQRIERPETETGEAVEPEGLPLPEGETAEPTAPTAMPQGEAAQGDAAQGEGAPGAVPMPEGETAEPLPEAEVETAAPTGPTAVEFSGPTQVIIPGSEPTQVEMPSEPKEEGPTRVVMPGDDDSSQSNDK